MTPPMSEEKILTWEQRAWFVCERFTYHPEGDRKWVRNLQPLDRQAEEPDKVNRRYEAAKKWMVTHPWAHPRNWTQETRDKLKAAGLLYA